MPLISATPFRAASVVWNVSSASFVNFRTFDRCADAESWYVDPSGVNLIVLDGHSSFLLARAFTLVTPNDMFGTINTGPTKFLDPTISAGAGLPDGLTFSPDGNYMYVSDKDNPPSIHTFALSTPFDVSTAVAGTPHAPRGFGSGPMVDLHISPNGDYMVEIEGPPTNRVNVYTLTTPFLPSGGMTLTSQYALGYTPFALQLNASGTQMVLVEQVSGFVWKVNVYDLPSAWNVAGITGTSSSFTTGSLSDSEISGINITTDGTKLHLYGTQQEWIYTYNL